LTWKWTRHFLASKYGSGEWIMEGEVKTINHHYRSQSCHTTLTCLLVFCCALAQVPSPVVMCLQLMRYAAAIRAEELSRQLTAAPSVLASSRGSKS